MNILIVLHEYKRGTVWYLWIIHESGMLNLNVYHNIDKQHIHMNKLKDCIVGVSLMQGVWGSYRVFCYYNTKIMLIVRFRAYLIK